MQIPYPHRPTYTNDSLSLTPPLPTILQQRLATPPTSPETPAPQQLSLASTGKRLRSSKSFPLISATNRVNSSSSDSRVADEKPSADVFSSVGSRASKPLRRKQSRGILRDDYDVPERATGSSGGFTERGLKKKTSFQRSAGQKQVRLRRADNSTRSLRSEYHVPSNTPPHKTLSAGRTRHAENEDSKRVLKKHGGQETDGETIVVDDGAKARESLSSDVPILENNGSALIPRSKSDPLSGNGGRVTPSDGRNVAEGTTSANDSDEETKRYDPKEVFSKERFLNRHSKDFGHLYAYPATTTVPINPEGAAVNTTPDDAIEDLAAAEPEIDLALVRREGREKRRSWALYRAGLISPAPSNGSQTWGTTPHSAPAASTSHPISQEQRTSATARPGHHRRTSSFLTGAHHPSISSSSPATAVSSQLSHATVQRQKVMSGGFKPLALVAVAKAASPGSPAGAALGGSRRNRWSVGNSGAPFGLETALPTAGTVYDEKEEELSVIDERASEKSRGSIAVSRFSDHQARFSLSSIPPHLRTHSSSTTSSSLSSLGAIINNGSSPSKSTSSCSSGGEHLGGPRVLGGEAFNFRMSVVSGRGASKSVDWANNSIPASHSGSTAQTTSSDGFDTIQTDSRMTLRGGRPLDGQVDPANALVGNDKDSRIARRRARAFLVAGLKLEEGSLRQEDTQEQYHGHGKLDTNRRAGLVIDQPIDMEDTPAMQESKARKRYSLMRAEKTVPSVVLQPSTEHARLVSNLPLRMSLKPSLLPHPHAVHGYETSSPSSYHTAIDRHISDSPVSDSSGEQGFMEMLEEREQPPAENYQGRQSVSPISVSSSVETVRKLPTTDVRETARVTAGNGISIAIYDPTGHAREASLSSVLDSAGVEPRPVALRDDSQGSSGDLHLEQPEMNSLDLERQLFFHRPSTDPVGTKSIRKVKSDFGLGSSQIALPHGRSMSRPTSPVVIHEDSAGASPGRPTRANWSKGVRHWWRDESKTAVENETERGFGLGRAGDGANIPVISLPPESGQESEKRVNAAAPTPNPHLKEKRSWRPFLAALKGGRSRIVERASHESMATSQQMTVLPISTVTSIDPALMQTAQAYAMTTMTLDPPFMEQSLGACSAESTPPLTTMTTPSTTNWLSPLPLPTSSMTRTRDRYSPFSATSSSPQTPEHLIKSPGIAMRVPGIQHSQQPHLEQSLQPSLRVGTKMFSVDSRNTLSLTPDISPNTPHHNTLVGNRLHQSRQFTSEPRFDIQKPAPIHLPAKKVNSLQDLSYANMPSKLPHQVTVDEHGRDVRGPLHGLGLHVGWADETTDYKGKAKATTAADEAIWEHKLHHQASQLFKLKTSVQGSEAAHATSVSLGANLGRRPAVGILTNANLSPTANSPPTWHHSASAITVVEPSAPPHSASVASPTALIGDEDTVLAPSVTSSPYTAATFGKTRSYHRESQAMINMHCRELQPAKLFFLLGFLLGPWVWLLGGWGLSPAGYFASGTNTIHLGLSWKHAQAARLRRQVVPPRGSPSSTHKRPRLPPMSRDEPDKWVKRNRWAAVASAGIFIPAMCVGFASVGVLL